MSRGTRMATRLVVFIALMLQSVSIVALARPGAAKDDPVPLVAPALPAFERTWARTDQPVAVGQVSRTWMWGPEAFTAATPEPYAESPGGQRQTQYFDKSRMELTHPDAVDDGVWYVTNGLLVVELVTGQLQLGDAQFEARSPAEVNVAGDDDDPTGPTYRTFDVLRAYHPFPVGGILTQRVNRDSYAWDDLELGRHQVTAAYLDEVTNHSVASPFWAFMHASGPVQRDGQVVEDRLFANPFYATGRPIAEAYWASVKLAGAYQDVLIQCFERRCLTYTPTNPEGWQVEAGNVGRHYYRWRHAIEPLGSVSQPIAAATGGIVSYGDEVTLSVPPQALSRDTVVTITKLNPAGMPAVAAARALSMPFDISVGGASIVGALSLTVTATSGPVRPETVEDGFLAYYDEDRGAWAPTPGVVDVAQGTITIQTEHLSWWRFWEWDWDAATAIIQAFLSLDFKTIYDAVLTVSGECKQTGNHTSIDSSHALGFVTACVDSDTPTSAAVRLYNTRAFPLTVAPSAQAHVTGFGSPRLIFPLETIAFSTTAGSHYPITMSADIDQMAWIAIVFDLVLRALPASSVFAGDIGWLTKELVHQVNAVSCMAPVAQLGATMSYELSQGRSVDVADAFVSIVGGLAFWTCLYEVAIAIAIEAGDDALRNSLASMSISKLATAFGYVKVADFALTLGDVFFGVTQAPAKPRIVINSGATAPAPSPPTSLTASALDTNRVRLTWTPPASNDQTGYQAYFSQGGSQGPWQDAGTLGGGNWTTYDVGALAAGTYYCFTVEATNAAGASPRSNVACATTHGSPPNPVPTPTPSPTPIPSPIAPSDLTAYPSTYKAWQQPINASVSLSWTNRSSSATELRVLGVGFTYEARLQPNTQWHSVSIASHEYDRDYCFVVMVINAEGKSATSNTACARLGPPPAAPTSFTATIWDAQYVRLRWQDNSNDETGFHVVTVLLNPDGHPIVYIHPGWRIEPNTSDIWILQQEAGTYCYVVFADNIHGRSESNPACVTRT